MLIRHLLETRVSSNILVCDVQPAYHHRCKFITPKICELLNNQTGRRVVLFNGEGTTDDDTLSVIEYYIENGLDQGQIDNIEFIEKEYGFFRSWMDYGVSDSVIIKVVRAMVMQRTHDSRYLELSTILTPAEFDEVPQIDDCIYLPSFLDFKLLKNLSPFFMMGGGEKECLREIELICNSLNIKYKRIKNLIY